MIVPDIADTIGVAEHDALRRMFERLDSKKRRHKIRQHYYDAHAALRDLGVSVPPTLAHAIAPVVGWPTKAVDALSRRVKFEGFVLPGAELSTYGIDEIVRDNRLDVELPMIQTSALIHSCAFIATTLGDTSIGEPEVLISTYDATMATGLWRPAQRDLGAALLVNDEDEFGPKRLYAIFPHKAISIWREDESTRWHVRQIPNTLGRVPVEPMVYRPRLQRPFGSSRISRPVMYLTDAAMRVNVRSEVGAEFFNAPQRYLLGADESQFIGANGERKTTWDLLMGRLLALPADEETGEKPEVGQFNAASMTPHIDHLNMLTRQFAAETGMSAESLGVLTSNPSSAEGIYAGEKELVIEAEATCDGFEPAIVRTAQNAFQLREGTPSVPDVIRSLGARWRDPSTPSRAEAVDATLKLTQGDKPIIPHDSRVAAEMAGLSPVDVERVMADRRRAEGRATIAAISALRQQPAPTEAPPTEEA